MRYIPDIVVVSILLALACLFYIPDVPALQSHYVLYADCFERAGHVLNPDYDGAYLRYPWEAFSPLMVLWSRCVLFVFRDPGTAVLVAHLAIVLVSLLATYVLSRVYLSVFASLLVTSLLFFGRVHLPITRGLGVTQVHLLIPLFLLFLVVLPRLLARGPLRFRGWGAIGIASACLAGMYTLGQHEVIFAAMCLAAMGAMVAGRWAVRSVRARRLAGRPPVKIALAVGLAAGLALGLMFVVHKGIPKRLKPVPFWGQVRYEYFLSRARKDAGRETAQTAGFKARVYRGSFVEGRYLTPLGSHHENAFLIPGPGFNGIVPLFILPGLAIGLVRLARTIRPLCRPRKPDESAHTRVFALFLLALLAHFVVMLAASSDPKPTRYTFGIFALYALAAWGYESLARRLAPCLGKRRGAAGADRLAKILVMVPVLAFGALHLHKNHRDLQTYLDEYSHQIPTIALGHVFQKAFAEPPTREVAVYVPTDFVARHPSLGLWMRFAHPPNVRVFSREQLSQWQALPDSVRKITTQTVPDVKYYWSRRSQWPEVKRELAEAQAAQRERERRQRAATRGAGRDTHPD